jgi:hypothetical protein
LQSYHGLAVALGEKEVMTMSKNGETLQTGDPCCDLFKGPPHGPDCGGGRPGMLLILATSYFVKSQPKSPERDGGTTQDYGPAAGTALEEILTYKGVGHVKVLSPFQTFWNTFMPKTKSSSDKTTTYTPDSRHSSGNTGKHTKLSSQRR